MLSKPTIKPQQPNFSSGPCAKRPGYDLANLNQQLLGRSHRSAIGKQALQQACDQTHELLQLPADYRVGIVPGSDTGAMEMILWSVLGARPVDIFAWESFGREWLKDVTEELKIQAQVYTADYGQLPDLGQAKADHDVIFTFNGTTSGVKVPHCDWIADDRTGLTICDATSAVFAMDMPWHKLDVVTFSWQKVLGGEGAHGVLILSPRAVERLESFDPDRALPKLFRLTEKGKLIEGIFRGETINTPSMLCVADYLDALDWVQSLGGVDAAIARSNANLAVIEDFVAAEPWIEFLAAKDAWRSNTSVCLALNANAEQIKAMVALLEQESVAFDINAYKAAPAGLRIWCGATVEQQDLVALMPWLKWAYQEVVGLS